MSRDTQTADDTDAQQLVIFTLGREQYALPIGTVQEIIRYQQPRSVVSIDSSLRGVINLRGRIVPVHSLASRLGVGAAINENGKIVVLESEGRTVGVIVDSVDEVITIGGHQLEQPPTATDAALVESIARIADRLVMLVNPDAVIAPQQLAA